MLRFRYVILLFIISLYASTQVPLSNGPYVHSRPVRLINAVPVPFDFPEPEFHIYGETAPGFVFTTIGDYLLMLENDGTPYFYRKLTFPIFDLMVQDDGLLSYRTGYCTNAKFIVMDTCFVPIDTLECGNGYVTGGHDFIRLPDGHTVFIGITYISFDMSSLVPGGDPHALLEENSVVEVDENGVVVSTWDCMDHFSITDARDTDLTQMFIEYVHINSLKLDYDGNFIISNRPHSEITKINRQTGEIIWRLGGVHNEFTLINETGLFTFQHSARPVPGEPNHYTVFDNGSGHNPAYTRAVEYRLDPEARTAEKVWEYVPAPVLHSRWRGNAQRLQNGNTFINWGDQWLPLVTEVTAEGDVVYEITGADADRSFRFAWHGRAAAPFLIAESGDDYVTLIFNQFGAKDIREYRIYAARSGGQETLLKTVDQPWAILDAADFPEQPGDWVFRVASVSNQEQVSPFSNSVQVHIELIDPFQNLLRNGAFLEGIAGWEIQLQDEAVASGQVADGAYHLQVQDGGYVLSSVVLNQHPLRLKSGAEYRLELDAWAGAGRIIEIRAGSADVFTVRLTPSLQHFSEIFTYHQSDDPEAWLRFYCGGSYGDLYFDNVVLRQVRHDTVEPAGLQPGSFQLLQNYPNPFNPMTMIRYRLSTRTRVRLEILNLRGEIITLFSPGIQEAGEHVQQWNASGLPGGIYLCRLSAGGKREIKKIVFEK